MCMSTVYRKEVADNNILVKNVRAIRADGDKLVLTDIMERETVLEGKLVLADLINGVVIVDC